LIEVAATGDLNGSTYCFSMCFPTRRKGYLPYLGEHINRLHPHDMINIITTIEWILIRSISSTLAGKCVNSASVCATDARCAGCTIAGGVSDRRA